MADERALLVRIEKFIDAVAPWKISKEMDSIRREVTAFLALPQERAVADAIAEVVETAHSLISNIEENGIHDNWKGLAAALRKYNEVV